MSRLLKPFDINEFVIDIEELNYEEEEIDDIVIEQHICTVAGIDIDGIVLECNRFEKDNHNALLKNDVFKQ
jgi:hypothetical protein